MLPGSWAVSKYEGIRLVVLRLWMSRCGVSKRSLKAMKMQSRLPIHVIYKLYILFSLPHTTIGR